jgi:diaminopimelate epimerase
MTRHLQKWHGAGNDFVVAVGDGEAARWNAARAVAVCDRHVGIGADGLLIADTANDQLTMTLYNADGSIAEMSGNGIRCLVAAYQRATGDARGELVVQTLAGERTVTMHLTGSTGVGAVTMGKVNLLAPLEGTLGVASVGNPHVVVLDNPDWTDSDRERLAADWAGQVGGANVEFVSPIDEGRVAIRVIERGVGWTLACGTGSCATAAVCHARGLTDRDIIVRNPGGELRVSFPVDEAILEGPVVHVADVEWFQE